MTTASESRPGLTGDHTSNGRPHTFTSLTPFIAVVGADKAIDFYCTALGARELSRTEMGGVIVHAELGFDEGRLQLGEVGPDYGLLPQPSGNEVSFSLGLYCADVDAAVARAEAAGATVREPLTDFASGDRFASIRDPFGVRWSLMSRVEAITDEESERRVAEWAAAQG